MKTVNDRHGRHDGRQRYPSDRLWLLRLGQRNDAAHRGDTTQRHALAGSRVGLMSGHRPIAHCHGAIIHDGGFRNSGYHRWAGRISRLLREQPDQGHYQQYKSEPRLHRYMSLRFIQGRVNCHGVRALRHSRDRRPIRTYLSSACPSSSRHGPRERWRWSLYIARPTSPAASE